MLWASPWRSGGGDDIGGEFSDEDDGGQLEERRSRTRSRTMHKSRWQRGVVLQVGRMRLRRMMVVVGVLGWVSLQWLVWKWMTEIQFEGARDRFLRRHGPYLEHIPSAKPSLVSTGASNLVLEVE